MGWFLLIIGILGWHIGMYGMFQKAGIAPWKALIPFYNTWCIVEKCGIKKLWFWLQFIPIAGQFITIWITIIFVMHFGRFNVLHHSLTTFLPFIYFPYLGFAKDERWGGKKIFDSYKKPAAREWVDAGAFAIVAATIIRTFVFEAYVIPTGSMEKTLLINDFLFVNKISYGQRMPMTPLSIPFVHNLIPRTQIPSYIKSVQAPYYRLPGYTPVKRYDVVVFNFPAGDTVVNLPEYGSANTFYDLVRQNGREAVMNEFGDKLLVHPVDKTDNYIKRCVAIGGDVLQVRDGMLYINNQLAPVPAGAQRSYTVHTNGTPIDFEDLKDNQGIELRGRDENVQQYWDKLGDDFMQDKNYKDVLLTQSDSAYLKKLPNVVSIEPNIEPYIPEYSPGALFPYDTLHKFSRDNFGPLYIPKAGATITLSPNNIAEYRRLITNYEHHTLEEHSNGQFVIDGKPATTYTFKYNYYWMMGDSRHNSQDSRYWGLVPETHIVGKASFIWFSWQNGPRWKRIFRSIQ